MIYCDRIDDFRKTTNKNPSIDTTKCNEYNLCSWLHSIVFLETNIKVSLDLDILINAYNTHLLMLINWGYNSHHSLVQS